MDDHNKKTKPRRFFRFQLRTLFVLVALVALLTVPGIEIYERYHSFPLSEAVDELNIKLSANTEVTEKLITEDEIVRSIESQLPTFEGLSEEMMSLLRRIISSRRVPLGTTLEHYHCADSPPGRLGRVWCIRLAFHTPPTPDWGLIVRDTEHLTQSNAKTDEKQ